MSRSKKKKQKPVDPFYGMTKVEIIYKREKGRCFWCQQKVIAPWKLICHDGILPIDYGTKDHVMPISKGGTNDRSNLVLCCYSCNVKKGNFLINPATGQVISPSVLSVFLKV